MAIEVVNKLVVEFDDAEVLEEFLETIKGSDSSRDEVIDFNVWVLMPKELEDTVSGSKQWKSLYYYAHKTNQRDAIPEMNDLLYNPMSECLESSSPEEVAEYMAIGETYFNNYKRYGATDWYMWRNKYWGTKRNAYNSHIVEDSENSVAIYFTTAWNGVPYLMGILVGWFPELNLTYKFASEVVACNCGVGHSYDDGEFIFDMVDDGSDEALRLYCECWGNDESDFIKVNGEWMHTNYIEDSENNEDEE